MKDFSKLHIFLLFLLFISIQSIDPKTKEVYNLKKGNNTQKRTGKNTETLEIPINTYNRPKNRTTTNNRNNRNNKNNINNNHYKTTYDKYYNKYKKARQNNNNAHYNYEKYKRNRSHRIRFVPGVMLFLIWICALILYFLVNRRKKTFNVMLNAGGNNLPNYMNI